MSASGSSILSPLSSASVWLSSVPTFSVPDGSPLCVSCPLSRDVSSAPVSVELPPQPQSAPARIAAVSNHAVVFFILVPPVVVCLILRKYQRRKSPPRAVKTGRGIFFALRHACGRGVFSPRAVRLGAAFPIWDSIARRGNNVNRVEANLEKFLCQLADGCPVLPENNAPSGIPDDALFERRFISAAFRLMIGASGSAEGGISGAQACSRIFAKHSLQ